MESNMIGNTNATSNGSSGGSTLKVLNVIQVGNLTRNGAIVSGFSQNDYLRLGAKLDGEFLNLDNSIYYKDIMPILAQANSWEIVVKCKITSYPVDPAYSAIVGQASENRTTPQMQISSNKALGGSISFTGSSWDIQLAGNNILDLDTWYWCKLEFTGNKYSISHSIDGINWIEDDSQDSTTKITNLTGELSLGCDDRDRSLENGSIDLSETYIKVNGEYWWKGCVEQKVGQVTINL